MKDHTTLFLFDVDGTLTEPRLKMKPDMHEVIQSLQKHALVGFVGGSDLEKMKEQLNADTFFSSADWFCSENGLVSYSHGKLISKMSIKDFLSESQIQELINFTLEYIAKLKIPVKRGTFVEFRNGMINLSPIGRNCSQEERVQFFLYDKTHGIREKMVQVLRETFAKLNLQFSIGGQISIDVFPIGWDKTFCLRHIDRNVVKTVHFFGDKISPGGNDYEIFSHPEVIGHHVTSPQDTICQLKALIQTL